MYFKKIQWNVLNQLFIFSKDKILTLNRLLYIIISNKKIYKILFTQ